MHGLANFKNWTTWFIVFGCFLCAEPKASKFTPTDAEQRELHFIGIKLHLDKMMKEDKEIDYLALWF